jgi:hypothetical protein
MEDARYAMNDDTAGFISQMKNRNTSRKTEYDHVSQCPCQSICAKYLFHRKRTNSTYMYIETVCLIVLNATFKNISVLSWRSVVLVEETGGNHRPVAN